MGRRTKKQANENRVSPRAATPETGASDTDTQLPTIPGYRVLRRLGLGGSGEIFEAEAPGGFRKALKIVPLNPHNPLSKRERDGLRLIRSIRHPYLLSIDRLDIEEECLRIVMELADRTLLDEYRNRLAQGHAGIPRRDLLRWLQEAAEVLDLLNLTYNLQHLDIKPGNLFLMGGHLKVGDFGLLREVGGEILKRSSNAISPTYAAPELFDGLVTPTSDQYSLAVVYLEMLSGQRPYSGETVRQLAYQHLTSEPDLSAAPASDRAVLAKAFRRSPEARFESCLQFVEALWGVSGGGLTPTVADAEQAADSATPVDSLIELFQVPRRRTVSVESTAPLMVLDKDAASMTTSYVAQCPASVLAEKTKELAKDWGAQIVEVGPAFAKVSFPTRTSWFRRWRGKKDVLLLQLEFFERAGGFRTTLVEATASFHGRKLAAEAFGRYARTILQLVKSFLLAREAPAEKLRRHVRTPVESPVVIVPQAGIADTPIECTAVDISPAGMGIVSRAPMQTGSVCVHLPGCAEPVWAQVVNCRKIDGETWRLGLAFAQEIVEPHALLGT
jgi:hypothetical protein